MDFDYNKNVGLFKFQSGYRKFHLNSPNGCSRKIISAQIEFKIPDVSPLHTCTCTVCILSNLCRATSGGYENFGCSREVLFPRGCFQWSMSLRGVGILSVERGSRSLALGAAVGG